MFRSQAAIVSKKSTVYPFSYRKVKVHPGSSFGQTIKSWSPRCYIPIFVEIGQMVLEKKFLKGFNIYGHGGHLDDVTSIMLLNFKFIVN